MKVLVVEDEEMKRLSLQEDLSAAGYPVTACADGEEALDRLAKTDFPAVVADLKMPGMDGMELLKRIKAGPNPNSSVILITAYGSIPVAVEAMRLGAHDFVTKPFHNEKLLPILKEIERRRSDECLARARDLTSDQSPDPINSAVVGGSPAMCRVRELAGICAGNMTNLLLCGETGTGKDLLASVIHKNSTRATAPLVKVCCAVFPRELVANELYGHEKGAFTGAERKRIGRFELAAGGTLYLDDIDDIPFGEQIKLLQVIEERVFERIGGNRSLKADVRIIASTKKNLGELISAGLFREDLFYRLNIMRIDLPALRERIEDLPQLSRHLLEQISEDGHVEIEPAAMAILGKERWPGNVRELKNTLQRAWLTGKGTIRAETLLLQLAPVTGKSGPDRFEYRERVAGFERDLLVRALARAGGNKSAAARSLGMKVSTFRDHLQRLGLN